MKRRGRWLVVTIGAFASALAACSVITGLNGDYTRQDEDNGSDADAAVGDEGSSSGFDGPSQTDANVDAGTFCQQYGDAANVGFCWDFENSAGNPLAGFFNSDTVPNGQLEVAPDSGVNHSLGLRATITNPTESSQAYLQQQIGNGAAGTGFADFNDHLLEFDFVVYENTVNVVTIGSLGYESATKKLLVTGLATYWDMASTTEVDISSPPGNPGGSQVEAPPGQWMHAKIHLTRASGTVPFTTHSFVSKQDGSGAFEVTQDMPPFDSGTGPTEILVGAYFTSMTDAGAKISVGIDNILYTHSK